MVTWQGVLVPAELPGPNGWEALAYLQPSAPIRSSGPSGSQEALAEFWLEWLGISSSSHRALAWATSLQPHLSAPATQLWPQPQSQVAVELCPICTALAVVLQPATAGARAPGGLRQQLGQAGALAWWQHSHEGKNFPWFCKSSHSSPVRS